MKKRQPFVAYGALLAVTSLITVIILSVTHTPGVYGIARGAALIGYQFVFLAVLSSAFMRPLVRAYRQPFVKLHHMVSVTGLVLLTLHPILLVIATGSAALLTAAYTSGEFLRYGGSPALSALFVAAAAAVARSRIASVWRYVHWLNYLALLLGTIHAMLIGTSTATFPWLRAVLVVAALAAAGVFVVKRRTSSPQTARSRR